MFRTLWRWVTIGGLVGAAGCTVHERRQTQQPPVALPAQFAAATPTAQVSGSPRWWLGWHDAALTAGIDAALAGNLDLRQGRSRLEEALAIAGQSGSSKYPSVEANVGVSRSKSNNLFFGGSQEFTTYNASIGASYELDLWGRIGALADAADADVAAARFDLDALAVTLAASYAEAYYSLVEQRALRALLDAQSAVGETQLELVEARFANGLASAVDVLQQREQLGQLESNKPLVDARIEVFSAQLAVLSGAAPGSPAQTIDALPALPALPALGVPSEVLGKRPDVLAAQARITAQDHRVGAAIAGRYPAIRLNASVGLQSVSLSDLIDRWVWNLGANIVAPLFDGGARKAEVRRQKAALEGRIAALGKVLLDAATEAHNALVQEQKQTEYLAQLDARLELARTLQTETLNRYTEGVTDYLPVISATRALQTIEQARLGAQRQLISYRIQLYRALGGDWGTAQ